MRNPETGPLPDLRVLDSFLSDTATTAYHEAIIQQATDVARTLTGVEGAILKGSLGKGQGDIFSDIDFQILHNGDASTSSEILDSFMDRLDEVGTLVHFFPSSASVADCIIYLHPFVKLELSVGNLEIASQRWRTSQARILFDRNGHVRKAIDSARAIEFSIEEHMLVIRGRAVAIPTFCYITAGHIVRGELFTALDGINWMRADMLMLSGWLLGQWDEGPRRAEARFPPEVLQHYRASAIKEVDEIWDSLSVLLDWYADWMVPRFDDLDIPHSGDQVTQMRQVLRILRKKATQNPTQ